MGTTSDDYERFIAELIHNLEGTHRRITKLDYARFNSIRGISGQVHQIGVSFIDNNFSSPRLVVIECKRLNKPIDLEHVKIVKATLDDILASGVTPDHAISLIVITVGAREGARRYADYYGIRIEAHPAFRGGGCPEVCEAAHVTNLVVPVHPSSTRRNSSVTVLRL